MKMNILAEYILWITAWHTPPAIACRLPTNWAMHDGLSYARRRGVHKVSLKATGGCITGSLDGKSRPYCFPGRRYVEDPGNER